MTGMIRLYSGTALELKMFENAKNCESSSEADSDAPKRKRKGNKPVLPRKRSSNSGSKAPDTGSDSDSEHGIRVTAKSKKRRGGLLVDEIIYLDSAPELWDIPAFTNRVAYILDLTDTPELLGLYRPLTLDAYVKKQCQDAWTGPTGSAVKNLAKVVLFDPEAPPVLCRRSNLKCAGYYICSLAADDFLDACRRWDDTDKPHENISAPIRAAKVAESESVAAAASAFSADVPSDAEARVRTPSDLDLSIIRSDPLSNHYIF
ncbi:hypothetical protein B0H13DRAFT_1930419 [Mycena leptocephala]|nr:hypothetical protein B0H13DRAFT_1930419 [Mycena leptocephala]